MSPAFALNTDLIIWREAKKSTSLENNLNRFLYVSVRIIPLFVHGLPRLYGIMKKKSYTIHLGLGLSVVIDG